MEFRQHSSMAGPRVLPCTPRYSCQFQFPKQWAPPYAGLPLPTQSANQDGGCMHQGHHQGLEYSAYSIEEYWVTKARAWATAKAACNNHEPFGTYLYESGDQHFQGMQQRAIRPSSNQYHTTPLDPLRTAPIGHSEEPAFLSSKQISDKEVIHAPYMTEHIRIDEKRPVNTVPLQLVKKGYKDDYGDVDNDKGSAESGKSNDSISSMKKINKLQENGVGSVEANPMSGSVRKRLGRSTRRKHANRRWLEEMGELQKNNAVSDSVRLVQKKRAKGIWSQELKIQKNANSEPEGLGLIHWYNGEKKKGAVREGVHVPDIAENLKIDEKQSVDTGPLLLVEKESQDKEAAGPVKDNSSLENSTGWNAFSKKRKAPETLRSLKTVLGYKDMCNNERSAESSKSNCSISGMKKNNKFQVNDGENLEATSTPEGVCELRSKSSRRESAKKQLLIEMREVQKKNLASLYARLGPGISARTEYVEGRELRELELQKNAASESEGHINGFVSPPFGSTHIGKDKDVVRNNKLQENGAENVEATRMPVGVRKRPSRSARRKYAKRAWLKELRQHQKKIAASESDGLINGLVFKDKDVVSVKKENTEIDEKQPVNTGALLLVKKEPQDEFVNTGPLLLVKKKPQDEFVSTGKPLLLVKKEPQDEFVNTGPLLLVKKKPQDEFVSTGKPLLLVKKEPQDEFVNTGPLLLVKKEPEEYD